VEASILKLLMHRSSNQTTSIDTNLLLALPLFMVEMAEPAVIPILASAFCMKATATAEPPQVEALLEASADNSVADWPVEKVMDWLSATGLGHVSKNFEEHRITGDVLLELTSSDLEEIGVHALGDKKRLLRAVTQLMVPGAQASCPPPPSWQAVF
jgi:hypothetical protein